MANFKALYQECFALNGAVADVGDCLDVSQIVKDRVCAKLGSGGWTYLLSNDPDGDYIQLAVECDNGELKVTEIKPAGATIAAGAELYFDWSDDAWCARFDCKAADTDSEVKELADMFKSDAFTFEVVDGKICIEPVEGAEGCAGPDDVWVHCNKEFYVKDGKIRVRSVANPVADATYDPAKVILKDGKPTFAASSCPPLEKPSCDPCLDNQTGN